MAGRERIGDDDGDDGRGLELDGLTKRFGGTVARDGLSAALLVAAAPALVPLCGRIHADSVLRTGARVKLRQALRGG